MSVAICLNKNAGVKTDQRWCRGSKNQMDGQTDRHNGLMRLRKKMKKHEKLRFLIISIQPEAIWHVRLTLLNGRRKETNNS